jgi:hypothetical protein
MRWVLLAVAAYVAYRIWLMREEYNARLAKERETNPTFGMDETRGICW